MFIEQSVGRRRVVRLVFVLCGFLPCVLLAVTAWWRHSPGYLAALGRQASIHLGVPVAIGASAHLRPGAMRLRDVVVGGQRGENALVLSEVEVEEVAAEVRLRVPRLECSPAAFRLLAGVAGEWLGRPQRFPQAWVVDVSEVTWILPDGGRITSGAGWHLECAAAGDERGVWARREPASAEEVRVRSERDALVVEGRIEEPLPVQVLAAMLRSEGLETAFGGQSLARGRINASRTASGWSGSLAGTIERIDLSGVASRGRRGLVGEATIELDQLVIGDSRLSRCDLRLSAGPGVISQDLLEDLVGSLGCRPGSAFRAIGGDQSRRFDELACRVIVDETGLVIRPIGGDALIRSQGLNVLEPPPGPLAAERLAWLFSPAGRPAVPASSVSAWLISVLPAGGGAGGF